MSLRSWVVLLFCSTVPSGSDARAESDHPEPIIIVATGSTAESANDALTTAGIVVESGTEEQHRAARIAVRSMARAQQEELAEELVTLRSRLEVRTNPLAEDLEDAPLTASLERVARDHAPALSVTSALASRRIAAPERTTVVAISDRCPESAKRGDARLRCLRAWSDSPQDGRAAFFAWPAVTVAVIRVQGAEEVAERLRSRARSADSSMAIVLTATDTQVSRTTHAERVRRLAKEALDAAHHDDALDPSLVEHLAAEGNGALVPWLHLEPGEVAVWPKMSALSRLDAFARETEEHAGERVAWTHKPSALR